MCLVLVFGERSDRLYLYLYFYVRESLIEIHFREQLFFLPSLICITVQETVLTSWILLHIYRKNLIVKYHCWHRDALWCWKWNQITAEPCFGISIVFWVFAWGVEWKVIQRLMLDDDQWKQYRRLSCILMNVNFDECKFWWM